MRGLVARLPEQELSISYFSGLAPQSCFERVLIKWWPRLTKNLEISHMSITEARGREIG